MLCLTVSLVLHLHQKGLKLSEAKYDGDQNGSTSFDEAVVEIETSGSLIRFIVPSFRGDLVVLSSSIRVVFMAV